MSAAASESVVLGRYQLGLSLAGFAALIYTLHLTRKQAAAAVEANKIATNLFVLGNRPHLSLDLTLKEGLFHPQPNGSLILGIDIAVHNGGNLPATDIVHVKAICGSDFEKEKRAISAFFADPTDVALRCATIIANKSIEFPRAILVSNGEIEENTYRHPVDGRDVFDIIVVGCLSYKCVGIDDVMRTGAAYHVAVMTYDEGRSCGLFVRRGEYPTREKQAELFEVQGSRFAT